MGPVDGVQKTIYHLKLQTIFTRQYLQVELMDNWIGPADFLQLEKHILRKALPGRHILTGTLLPKEKGRRKQTELILNMFIYLFIHSQQAIREKTTTSNTSISNVENGDTESLVSKVI